jgi:hypothetical protein
MNPISPLTETLEQQVQRLLRQWREETAHLSSSTRRKDHPAYQEIIGLGKAALPALLRDLEQTLDGHLAPALGAITAAHPVPAEARGRIKQVAEAWLRWAKENGVTG